MASKLSEIIHRSSPWTRAPQALYDDFETRETGLTDEEVAVRRKRYGANEFAKRKRTPILHIIWRQFSSPLIFVLIGAAILTTILKAPVDTTVILLAIIVNAALGFYQEYKAENALERLVAYIKDRTRVVRGGHEREIDSADIVLGDIVRLSSGARVPADMRIVNMNALSADEAILTGESLPVSKRMDLLPEDTQVADRSNMLFAGTLAVEGNATCVVVATGKETEIGKIASLVAGTKREPTPLQRSLAYLAWTIFAGVVVFIVGIFFLGISRGQPLLEMLLLSAAIAVGAIPEALPVSLTVILSVGVERIAKHKGIMRSLAAAETLGSTTLVMTDKTGTLTEARMELTSVFTTDELLSNDDDTNNDIEHLSEDHQRILTGAIIATDTVIENPDDPFDTWRLIGRPLETNIAKAGYRAGLDVVGITEHRRVSVIPFSSRYKFSVSHDTEDGTYFIMGAPDVLLAKSTLPSASCDQINDAIRRISDEGKRLLGVGICKAPSGGAMFRVDDIEDIEFMGILALYDPARPEVKEALARIRAYGSRVVMVTGDLAGTARAIARELDWDVPEDRIMTGSDIQALSDEKLGARLETTEIFARVTPEDKLRIGKLFQERGEVVAMTGDGVNDAPSLKVADIGVALGSGSDVAKGVADLVILDDNFDTIVRAIEEGRRIIANIRTTFVYLIASSLDEVILIGGGLIFGLPLPLTALQIIWVNFFTESFPALSLAFESGRIDEGHPASGRSIFGKEIRYLTITISIATSLVLFGFYWWAIVASGFSEELARSLLFACFASYILAVVFSLKDLRRPLFSYPLFNNIPLLASIALASGLLVASFAVPFLREVLGLVSIPVALLWIIPAWLIVNVAIVEAIKWGFNRRHA